MLFFANGREIKYLLGDEFLQVVVGEYQNSGQLMTPPFPQKAPNMEDPQKCTFQAKIFR